MPITTSHAIFVLSVVLFFLATGYGYLLYENSRLTNELAEQVLEFQQIQMKNNELVIESIELIWERLKFEDTPKQTTKPINYNSMKLGNNWVNTGDCKYYYVPHHECYEMDKGSQFDLQKGFETQYHETDPQLVRMCFIVNYNVIDCSEWHDKKEFVRCRTVDGDWIEKTPQQEQDHYCTGMELYE